MACGYIIARNAASGPTLEAEPQAAIAELKELGYEVELPPEGRIRPKKRNHSLLFDLEAFRKTAPREAVLIQLSHERPPRKPTNPSKKVL
jgi:hypothetical protein